MSCVEVEKFIVIIGVEKFMVISGKSSLNLDLSVCLAKCFGVSLGVS